MSDSPTDDRVKFWLEDPSALLRSWDFIPNERMSRDEKLNALTRLVLIITVALYISKYPYWSTFFLVSIVGIIGLKYAMKPEQREGFSVPPTYDGINYQETVLAPAYAEEWQVPPVTYDLVDEVYQDAPGEYGPNRSFTVQKRPINGFASDADRYVKLGDLSRYKDPLEVDPYGQFLTITNQLPGDENYIRSKGQLSTARDFANSAFMRHRNAFQEDMMRIQKKKIARRFGQNLYTVSSAYTSM